MVPNIIKDLTKYIYVLTIKVHFSKIIYCYLLENKSAELVLLKMEEYLAFCNPRTIISDNGTEFKNHKLQNLFKIRGIEY